VGRANLKKIFLFVFVFLTCLLTLVLGSTLKTVPVNFDLNPSRLSGDYPSFNFVIVTSNDLVQSFQGLANWRFQQGMSTAIYTTEYIYANYAEDISGANDNHQLVGHSPHKIRTFIKDVYRHCGTKFVLIGGDVNKVPTIWSDPQGLDTCVRINGSLT
jgi:hypothetical protein